MAQEEEVLGKAYDSRLMKRLLGSLPIDRICSVKLNFPAAMDAMIGWRTNVPTPCFFSNQF